MLGWLGKGRIRAGEGVEGGGRAAAFWPDTIFGASSLRSHFEYTCAEWCMVGGADSNMKDLLDRIIALIPQCIAISPI